MIHNKKTGAAQVLVGAGEENRRVDNFVMKKLGNIPRSRVYQMLRRGEIRVNGGRVKPDYRLRRGDRVRLPPVFRADNPQSGEPPGYLRQMLGDAIIYEDDDLLVLDKPAGIVVHGGSGRSFGVIEILRQLRPQDTDLQLAHRLDRETSGCLIISRNYPALQRIHQALKAGTLGKQYMALLQGRLGPGTVGVDRALGRSRLRSGERMVEVDSAGKAAESSFETIKTFAGSTLVRVHLYTGRTHQIRVHAAHLGHPVAGDDKYGDREYNRSLRKAGLKRMFLHASEITLPGSGGDIHRVEAPLPESLEKVLNNIKNNK